jgi:hypothetical protein
MRGGDDRTVIYRITTNEQGIINSITAVNNSDYIVPEIIVDNNKITISSNRTAYAIDQIEIGENCLYVTGDKVPASIFKRDENQGTYILITPAANVIYEHDEVRLEKRSDKSLEQIFKINPSRFRGVSFSENTSIIDYRYKNNPQNKYVYIKRGGAIFMTYYRMTDEFEEYRDRIKIEGNIYCDSQKINIINYFIVYSVYSLVADILFPFLFLENPVTETD